MPADDLVLNVRQIAGYPNLGVQATDTLLMQRGGLGGPYISAFAEQIVSNALASAGPMSVGVGPPPTDAVAPQIFTDNIAVALGATHNWNCYFSSALNAFAYRSTGVAAAYGCALDGSFVWGSAPAGAPGAVASIIDYMLLGPTGELTLIEGSLTVARDPAGPLEVATAQWVESVVAGLAATTVRSFMGRVGDVRLWIQDILAAGGAPIWSPRFTGTPMANTPSLRSNSERLATTAFVHMANQNAINCLLQTHPFVFTFNGRSGEIVLSDADLEAAGAIGADSPVLTGVPLAPTAPPGTDTDQIATTAFVQAALNASPFAPLNSPVFTGYVSAPTAAPGTSNAQVATTAYVMNAVAESTAGVASFNGRTGIVSLDSDDVTNAGGALIDSPVFTGTPQAPTAAPGTDTAQLATCAWVMNELGGVTTGVASFNGRAGAVTLTLADVTNVGGAPLASPTFGGVPTAPTAATNTSTQQIATTAFVMTAVNQGSVASFNGRTGAVTLTANDVNAAGALANPSAALTGTPTAPTATAGTNSTQLATCAFVAAAIAAVTRVTTFNTRSGAVTLTAADLTTAGGALLAGPTFTGNVTVAGTWGTATNGFAAPSVSAAVLGMNAIYSASSPSGWAYGASGVAAAIIYSGSGAPNQTVFSTANAGTAGGPITFGGTTTIDGSGNWNMSGGLTTGAGIICTGLIATSVATVNNVLNLATSASGAAILQFQSGGVPFGYLQWTGGSGGALSMGNQFFGQTLTMDGAGNVTVAAGTGGNFILSNGLGFQTGGGPWNSLSDARIKDVVGDYSEGLELLVKLRPVVYRYKGNDELEDHTTFPNRGAAQAKTKFVGLIAQDVEKVMPDLVTTRTGYIDGKAVNDLRVLGTGPLTYALINAIKQLAARVAALEGATA